MVEWSLLTPEIGSYNAVIGKILSTNCTNKYRKYEYKEKEAANGTSLKTTCATNKKLLFI